MQEKDIKNKVQKLQKFIKKFLLDSAKKNKNISIWHKDIIDKILPFATSGKSMRGLLVMLASDKEDNNTLKVATAIELIHSSFLIHDDIMDQDEKRRGQDSIYIQYKKELKVKQNLHYGISQAISLGDICLFLAFSLLNQIDNKNKEKLVIFFMDEVVRVGFGQMQDVFFGFANQEPDLETILDIHRSKTARYSISLPVVLGYLLNTKDINQKVLNNIIAVGEDLGIAFQMKDDELGIWGEQKSTGKGVLKDISKNKKTAIRLLLNNSVNKKEKVFLEKVFGNESLKEIDKKELFNLLIKYNIKEKHDKILKTYNQKAKNTMKKLPDLYQNIFLFIEDFNNKRIK